jgi:hypothetical protein
MTPLAHEGRVIVRDPPDAPMDMTADAAEISGLRLIDAADAARNPNRPKHPGPPPT